MIIPDLYRDIDSIKSYKEEEERYINKIPSSLSENMDISPSMVLSPSPAKTDWLGQFAYGNNAQKLF